MSGNRAVNILLVDDEPENLRGLEAALAALGANLVRATSGPDALRHVRADEFAAILLDVRRPTPGGFETARLIRAQPRSTTTPILFLTADGADLSAEEAYSLGAVDYLTRPVVPAALRARVGFFVELYRTTEALKAAERERAELRSRAQPELWRATLASIGDAVIATDTGRRVTFVNAEAERLTGWPRAACVGRDVDAVLTMVNEATRERLPCPVARVLDTGRGVGPAQNAVLVSRDGTERPIDDSAAPIQDEAGTLRGAVFVFRDVSEKHDALKKLRASEELLRLAADAAELGVWVWDVAADRVAWENDRPYAMFGLPRTAEPLTAARFAAEFVHPDDAAAFRRAVAGALQTGDRFHFLGRFRRRDGEVRWAEFTGRPIRGAGGAPLRMHGTAADVTDRMRAEEALRKKEAELTDFVENATVGLHWVGPDGTVLWANRAEFELLGYAREEYVGRHIAEFHADRPVIDDILGRLTGGEALHGYEARLRCKDGSIRHVLISSNVYREDGAFRHTRCVTRDVTEKKRMEDRHRFLVDQAAATQPPTDPDAITAATARVLGEHLGADRCAYAEMEADEDHFLLRGGYTRGVPGLAGRYALSAFGAEVLRLHRQRRPFVVADTEADPQVSPADRAAYRQAQIRAVISVPLHKGARFVAGMAVHQAAPRAWSPAEVELVELAAARCWEALERARTARRLRESEERFRLMADGIPNLAWMAGPDGHIDWYNSRWYEYTGTTPAAMAGWGWQAVHDPAELPAVLARWQRSIASGHPFDMVFPLRGKDGHFRPFLTRVLPQRDDRGAVVRWFGTNTDISELKAAEAALRERDRQKDAFMAMLAHELRNPLAPIKNALQLLELRQDAATVERVRQMVGRQVGQLSHLVDDLLEAARVTAGKVVLRTQRLDLAQLARCVGTDELPAFDAAGIALAVDAPGTPVWVLGD